MQRDLSLQEEEEEEERAGLNLRENPLLRRRDRLDNETPPPPPLSPPTTTVHPNPANPQRKQLRYILSVEPPNNGHIRDERFIHCSEVIPSSEVEMYGQYIGRGLTVCPL